MKRILFLLLLLSPALWAQDEMLETLPLEDLSGFLPQAGNWQIVGSVLMNPSVDIHDQPEPEPEVDWSQLSRRERRRLEREMADRPPSPPPPKAVTFGPGTGILLNMNDDSLRDNLATAWEHGDLILDLEVMIPKGSNSGIYLQGRYEVQLLDSWGVKDPRYGDIGGIYRNWERTPGKIYSGKAPSVNAARAPGLWQHMRIGFQAPRFDASGNKTANARFVFVDLNGVRIHENLEVPLPTGGPIAKGEVARGPLMIQGDHGPVAFRNIKVQHLQERDLSLGAIQYALYEGAYPSPEDLDTIEPDAQGEMNFLTAAIAPDDRQYAVLYEGLLIAPSAGAYRLDLQYQGGLLLDVDGQTFEGRYTRRGDLPLTVRLREGGNPFRLFFSKRNPNWPNRLGFFETGSFPRPLHGFDSYPPTVSRPEIFVDVGNKPRMLRAFLDFDGDRQQRLTHTIAVGSMDGAHYIYDLKTGNVACVWRGDFLDATPMWNSRGDGSYRPRGDVLYLFRGLSIARLHQADDDFPQAMDEDDGFHNHGYRIDEASGRPIFLYGIDSLTLADAIQPEANGGGLLRKISSDKPVGDDLYLKLAEGDTIVELPDGTWTIDQRFYIVPDSGLSLELRDHTGRQELVGRWQDQEVAYSIRW